MCKRTITVLAASVVLALASFLPGPAQAQSDSARPAAQDLASKPIGKVVAATGSVTIEHAGAVVVQANVPGQAGQTKVGDLVYLGDVVQTGAVGRVGINLLMAPRSTFRATPAWLWTNTCTTQRGSPI